jgi:hypothetical protein
MNYIGQFKFVSAHGRLLQAHTSGEMHASQDVANVGEEERWHVYAWPDGKVSLQNFRTNRWLSGEPSGRAICDRESPDTWEKWTLHGIQNKVALLAHHNLWLCGQPSGQDTKFGGEVIADRQGCGPWEQWSMVPCAGIPIRNQTWWNTVQKASEVALKVVPILVAL